MLGFLQRIGKSLMLPIAVLPAAGLLLRFGQPDLLDIAFIANAGDAIFANLALIFAMGVAIGFAKDNNGAAALSGAIGYLVLTNGTQALDENINMGVLGGIIAGIIAGLLYNRFHNVKLPEWLGFFSGRRFIPIVTSVAMVILAGIAGFAWPPVQAAIDGLGNWIIDLGAIGSGLFGLLNRLLIPLGLHHVLNSLFWFEFGEFAGKTGDIARFFAGDPTAGGYMTGFFPIMMFGLPAAAFAIIATAKPEKRKAVSGMFIGLALTSFLTGITEPIEFSFMFVAPLLYGVHAVLTGLSMWVTSLLGIRDGFTFSAGGIDYLLNFNIAEKPLLLLFIGLIYAVIYFAIFYLLIKALNLKTPGREDDVEEENQASSTAVGNDKYEQMANYFINDIGGKENISIIDNCATRLRLNIKEMDKVNDSALKAHGAKGVMKLNKTNLQIIVGTDVEFVADAMKRLDGTAVNTPVASETASPSETVGRTQLNDKDFVMPIEGKIIPITEVEDQVFSQKMMGDGFAIVPTKGSVVSPVNGEIINVFPTKHAIGIKSKQGYEILIHVGLDTVQLNGEGFTVLVQEGEQITKGQELLKFDLDFIKKSATSTVTPVIFTNLTKLNVKKQGSVKQGDSGVLSID
ncbi:N-acetylglucosamine-specific PTS transporter subunit IIBC [Metabacillus rhizolycopersici]|uniref:N-acetylglucosamine-specific PTS transporter subunit IIBC n=1 Tax=Metabacillus rhizolycopersici TaxID=2875709 RepID=A0ABS7UWC5_9BACI|nr:N-acetylglucosamine-specific PTS transporter subunit IIBC [Metabacillus rhizolycopersici]MBZ5752618.1 N-acetylglucosamine-specific PTS transporter subunit IIBC [Metabacillus rhizolycopersici]